MIILRSSKIAGTPGILAFELDGWETLEAAPNGSPFKQGRDKKGQNDAKWVPKTLHIVPSPLDISGP